MHDATYTPPASLDALRQRSLIVGVIGLVAAAAGAFVNAGQFFHAYLLAYLFWLAAALGGLALLMLQHLSGGGWGVVLRRVFEAEASRDLGASAWTTFRRVILPQSVPGIAAGAVFVFVLSIGNFVTPALLGGGQFQMIGNLIYAQFLTANDWPFGAAIAMVLSPVAKMLRVRILRNPKRSARNPKRMVTKG